MPTPFWHSAEAQAQLNRLDRPGFALEFLRRNTDYRSDYARTLRQIERGQVDSDLAQLSLARRWGLQFCP